MGEYRLTKGDRIRRHRKVQGRPIRVSVWRPQEEPRQAYVEVAERVAADIASCESILEGRLSPGIRDLIEDKLAELDYAAAALRKGATR